MEKVEKSSFKFKDIKMTMFYFEYKENSEDKEYDISIDRNITITNVFEDFENNIFENTVELNLQISDLEESPIVIKATIKGDFRSENIQPDQALKLFKINAPTLLLSYLRPIVSVATAKSPINYDIPFLDFSEKSFEKLNNK